MKHLTSFNTLAEWKEYMAANPNSLPNVSYIESEQNVVYTQEAEGNVPLYVEALEDIDVSFSATSWEYSYDNTEWTAADATSVVPVTMGNKLYTRATGLTPSSSKGIGTFSMTGKCNISGNAMSLLGGYNTLPQYGLTALFKNASVVSANRLQLPTLSGKGNDFVSMFEGCTSLVNAPVLPATTLQYRSYYLMFKGCTSLVDAPIISATTLASASCGSMFEGCTSLVDAPAIIATTLGSQCCMQMFKGCTSLVNAPVVLPATTLVSQCYSYMFEGCTSLVNAPVLPATTLAENCYYYMFKGCTSLVNAPVLPATYLRNHCYSYMFKNCKNLSYIKAMFTTTPSSSYTSEWLYGVASTGTFVKNSAATWDVTGASGVPSGWTIETADA